MSTRSLIGLDHHDEGCIYFIYCHFDGYPENNGKILKNHYSSFEKMNELISKGDCSSIDKTIEGCEFYVDKGEPFEDVKPKKIYSLDDFLDKMNLYNAEYLYIFIDGKISCYTNKKHEINMDNI